MNKIENQLIIHIGYPKTATTTLQNLLFEKHPKTLYMHHCNDPDFLESLLGLFFQREIPFKQGVEKHRGSTISLINKLENKRENLNPDYKIVFSDEGFLSHATNLRHYPKNFQWSPDPVSMARKLKILFDDNFVKQPKILITIREQLSIIRSFYAEMCFTVNRYHIRNFNDYVDKSFLKDKFDFYSSVINYWDIAMLYAEIFGRDNIYILPLEYLQNNDDMYKLILSDLLDIGKEDINNYIKTNKSKNIRKTVNNKYRVHQKSLFDLLYPKSNTFPTILPYLDGFFYKVLRHIKNPFTRTKRLEYSKEQYCLLREKYTAGNKRLSEEFNLDLDQYGYF